MKLLDIYSILLSNWLNGSAFTKKGRLQSTSIDAQYNVIFTKTHVKQVYRITGIKPVNSDIDFIDYLRDRMFEMHPDVELNILIDSHPVKLSVTDDKFNRAASKSYEAYESYSEAFNSQSGLARITGKTYRLPGGGRIKLSRERLDDLYQVRSSYLYIFGQISSGATVSLVDVFFEVVGTDFREVKRAGDDLYGMLGIMNIGLQQVKSANKAFMLEMGPAVPSPKTLNKKFLPQLLFSTENHTAFSPYKARGLSGDSGTNAILLGSDVRSRLPFSVDLFRSGNAQVFMVLGKTGSGKTYSCFQIALSLLALGVNISCVDIKGNEWRQIAPFCSSTKIINFDATNQSFVNTLRLDDIIVEGMDSSDAFNTAVEGTVRLMMLLVNLAPGEGNPADAELVVREAVMKVYSMRGVDPNNIASFAKTADISYNEILSILETLGSTASYTDEQKYMVKLARARLNNYFGTSGLFADSFRKEISLGDILHSDMVIYEFNKNSSVQESNLDALRVFMVQFLDMKKASVLKLQKRFLGFFYEELQRTTQFGGLLSFICSQVTGARSNNALVFLLLNSLKVFQSKEGQDLRSNITSIISGYCEDNDIDFIEEEMHRPWVARQLRLFAQKQNIYRHCFACNIDTGKNVYETVYRVDIPDSISRRFRTRTIKED